MHYSFCFFFRSWPPFGGPILGPLDGCPTCPLGDLKILEQKSSKFVVSGVFETLFLKQKSFNFGAKELHFGVKKLQKRGQKRPKMTAMSTFQKRKNDTAVRL